MADHRVTYTVNFDGNAAEQARKAASETEKLTKKAKGAQEQFDALGKSIVVFNQLSQLIGSFRDTLNSAIAPGVALDKQLADLSAVAGVTGKGLKQIEGYARETAKTFGVDSAQAVESYKLILSQLSPELGKYPRALQAMGKNIATLSKTMGGDATAAATVLTTAMNQYGVSLDDPMKASEEMARMMNVMAAAGKEGSAELPTIQEALKQCGMMAKSAGVSFEEANAAIQVLDKAGKKGSEGGVALRNVMSTLAQGRFLPKDTREELAAAGIDITQLADKTKPLSDRLRMLQPVMKDDALFAKLFGKENSAAAMALVQGTSEIDRYRQAITGTNTAYEQAEVIMESYAEKQARIQAKFDDIKISIFEATGDLGLWVQQIAGAALPVAQLCPLIQAATMAIKSMGPAMNGAKGLVAQGATFMQIRMRALGIASLQTGGMMKLMGKMGKSACREISVAIMNIPIVGWIAAAITLVIALITLIVKGIKTLWDKCYGFRVVVFTIWEGIKAVFSWIWEGLQALWAIFKEYVIDPIWNFITSIAGWVNEHVVQPVWNFIKSIANWVNEHVVQPVKNAISKIGSWFRETFSGVFDWIEEQFVKIYNKMAKLIPGMKKIVREGRKDADRSWAKDHPGESTTTTTNDDLAATVNATTGAASFGGSAGGGAGQMASGVATGGTRNTEIHINIGDMIKTVNLNGGVQENIKEVERMFAETLSRVLGMAELSV